MGDREGGSGGRGRKYTDGCSMLMYGRNQQNVIIILQVKINGKTGKKKKENINKVNLVNKMDTDSLPRRVYFRYASVV